MLWTLCITPLSWQVIMKCLASCRRLWVWWWRGLITFLYFWPGNCSHSEKLIVWIWRRVPFFPRVHMNDLDWMRLLKTCQLCQTPPRVLLCVNKNTIFQFQPHINQKQCFISHFKSSAYVLRFFVCLSLKPAGSSAWDDAEEHLPSAGSGAVPGAERLLLPTRGSPAAAAGSDPRGLGALCDLPPASRGDGPGSPAWVQPLIAGISVSNHRYASAIVGLKKFCIQLKCCSLQCIKYQQKFRERFNSRWNFWSCATSVDEKGVVV